MALPRLQGEIVFLVLRADIAVAEGRTGLQTNREDRRIGQG